MKLILLLIFTVRFVHATPVSRDVLALWDSQTYASTDPAVSNIHQKLEFVFNYYGMKLVYHDINRGLPKESSYRGIVTWFQNNGKKNSPAFSAWMKKQISSGTKMLMLGEPGFTGKSGSREEDLNLVNHTFRELGWEFSGTFFDNPLLVSVASNRGPEYTEYERSLDQEIPAYRQVRSRKKDNQVWLTLSSGTKDSESHVIIVSKKGAYVQSGLDLFVNPQNQLSNWRVNPFRIVSEVFNPDYPVPDTTTINGRRIFFSHIDGDGFRNESRFDRKKLSSEIIRDEVLKKYPFPVTVSVIMAEMNPILGVVKDKNFMKVAGSIFSLPNIEPASHTTYHPMSWAKAPDKRERESYLGKNTTWRGAILSWRFPGVGMDYTRETSESLHWMNQNLSGGKKAKLLLWSGSCRPPKDALTELEKENFLNMNGGDSRMDTLFNSVSNLSPLARNVEGLLQVYSANANENIYTDLWSPPFAGFKDVVQTFERTETPLRLKPVNVYYHFYSGEHHASLAAVKTALDWSMKQKLHPVFASEYVSLVKGFHTVKITRKGESTFEISDNGDMKTFRLKDNGSVPDYSRSKNVLGHQVLNEMLFLFLGDEPVTQIELTKSPAHKSFLVSANARVKQNKDGSYSLNGHVPIQAIFSSGGKLKTFTSQSNTLTITRDQL